MLGCTEMDIRNGIDLDIVIFGEVPCDDFKIILTGKAAREANLAANGVAITAPYV